ncbi:MAG: hypothetical protein A3H25_02775 [Sphingomonadales bacterium RIFCSPLOWO2_12_FULL_63_15]|nr:MAG: hypothetical protein A3H25_02775 [Sphingomonadales bacterium RIFCSPLOWO2_12_FULL_63_15]
MAVSTTDTYSGPYAANGVTVAFPFTFKAVSAADVAVIFRASSGAETPVDDGGFTVALSDDGGTVTFATAPASTVGDVFVVSEPAFIQSVEFASGQPFLPSVVNEVNDRDVVRALYLKGKIDRSPQTPLGGGAESQFPVVNPDGSWGFSPGTGNDPAFRADAASTAPNKGAALVGVRGFGDAPSDTQSEITNLIAKTVSVRDHGATQDDGTTLQQAFFSAAAQSVIGHINTPPIYAAIPQPLSAEVFVPDGLYHLTEDVDCGGKNITWRCSDGARFTANSAQYLIGKIARRSRVSNAHPSGMLDGLSGTSAVTGGGRADEPAQVFGITSPEQLATIPTVDGVGSYSEFRSVALTHRSAATFTANTAILATAAPVKRLRVGMVVQTTHSPWCRGLLTGWSEDGLTLDVLDWRSEGTTDVVTPSNGGSPEVLVNVIHKGWGFNTNVILTGDGYADQGSGIEVGIINTVATPASAEATVGRTWGNDVVNLSGEKFCMGFIARGAGFEGFRAAGQDIGFNAAAFASLGYAAPTVGYNYDGAAIAFRQRSADGAVQFSVASGNIELGDQSVASTPFIDFHSSGSVNDYDARIISLGGDATSGNAAVQIVAAETVTNQLRPADDNLSSLGTGSYRWSVVWAATGTISTSDPRLKRFIDDQMMMAAAYRAVLSLNILPFQWLDAISEKGDDARIHIGVNAQDVLDAFAAEGLDAHRFALFCEDPEVEIIEIVTPVEIPEVEAIEKMRVVPVVEGDRVFMREQPVIVETPKTRSLPILNEDGSPFMRKVVSESIEDGQLVMTVGFEPATYDEPVMTTKDVVTYLEQPTGRTRLGIRYEQLAMLMIAAMRDVGSA